MPLPFNSVEVLNLSSGVETEIDVDNTGGLPGEEGLRGVKGLLSSALLRLSQRRESPLERLLLLLMISITGGFGAEFCDARASGDGGRGGSPSAADMKAQECKDNTPE